MRNFLSIDGINGGVAAFPQCAPDQRWVGPICEAIADVLGTLAYNPLVQGYLFQANYYRDPMHLKDPSYLSYSQLARWNGETGADMSVEKANLMKTTRTVWILAEKDTMVWPRESEQWGAPPDTYPKSLVPVPMEQTHWYVDDTFGLRTAHEAGKVFLDSFKGAHCGFTERDLTGWLDNYFRP